MNLSKFQIFAEDAKISELALPGGTKFNPDDSSKISDLISRGGVDLVNLAFIGVGIVFFFNLILAGWDYLLSSGDPKKAAVASTRITNGLTGLVMAITAFLVVKIFSTMLGFDTGF